MSSLFRVLKKIPLVLIVLMADAGLLASCSSVHVGDPQVAENTAKSHSAIVPVSMFVVMGESGKPVARAITMAPACPMIRMDKTEVAMDLRAPAQTLPLRTTLSAPADSKPSVFPLLVCEKTIAPGVTAVSIEGQSLPVAPAVVNRIVVIGDTGCRIKKADHAAQGCNDINQYPFATVAQAAANWKPDMVIHVGDYLYRENACPEENKDCTGSPWGYGWDAWNADFFAPAQPLLHAAPWIMVRGNHESCRRAGQGWWRMMDPRSLLPGRDCNADQDDHMGDYSDPYAIPLGADDQVIVLDSSNTPGGVIPAGDIRVAKYTDMYHKLDALSQHATYNMGVNHHPILGFAAKISKSGKTAMLPGNGGLQSVFGAINPLYLPPRVNAMLSGHVHVWEQVSFSSPHPTQFVAGFSGTMEDTVPLPEQIPEGHSPAPGAIVSHFSSWVNGFGFMTMERAGPGQWNVKVWDTKGKQVNSCRIEGKNSVCDIAQVNTAAH